MMCYENIKGKFAEQILFNSVAEMEMNWNEQKESGDSGRVPIEKFRCKETPIFLYGSESWIMPK